MKIIGMIGGMSWESSADYYRIVNELVRQKRGGHHSARIIMYSVDFAEIERCQAAGQWDMAAEILCQAASTLEKAGAQLLVLCTNTMHKVADQIQAAVQIPFLHIADATGEAIHAHGLTRVGLLGTRYTMEQPFYKDRLVQMGFEVLVPTESQRQSVHDIIYQELCMGVVKDESRQLYCNIVTDLQQRGAQGVILGCTEIGMLIRQVDVPLPIFDTARIHAESAAALSLI